MNYGIIHNRRARADKDARSGGKNLDQAILQDPRLREIAKQLGLKSEDFQGHAQQVWKMLDDMAERDPSAYRGFVEEQLQQGLESSEDTAAVGLSAKKNARSLVPAAGMVVKCAMFASVKCQRVEQKLFLNLCSHEAIEIPKNPNSGRAVPRDPHAVPTTSHLEIPLVVGKVRKIQDNTGKICSVVDIVFHPWVLERCAWDANFKRDALQLSIEWVQHDTGVQLVSPVGKFIKCRYKGGVVVGNEIITARFPIEDAQQQARKLTKQEVAARRSNQDDDEGKLGLVTESPSDVLKQLTLSQEENQGQEQTAQENLRTAVEKKPLPSVKAAKPLIEEIKQQQDNQSENMTTRSIACKKTKKKSSVVCRGFLNAQKKPLYPNGSTEGREPSAYVKLLSRSKVIDTSTMMQNTQQQPEVTMKSTSKQKTVDDYEDHEFARLCEEADPELSTGQTHDGSVEALFGENMQAFAHLMKQSSPGE